jgi:hypothetical protein
MNTKIEIVDRLLKFGREFSLQRIAIMEYLMENFTHPTIASMYLPKI